jgi:signal peptidase II
LKRTRAKSLLFIFLLFGLDRITKTYFVSRFTSGESIPVVGDALRFTLVYNKGAIGGIMQDKTILLTAAAVLLILFMAALLFSSRMSGEKLLRAGLVMILAGALGNLFDRFFYKGAVIDFIDVDIPDIIQGWPRWPVFNVADSLITCGMILFIADMLFSRERKPDASHPV